MKPSAQILCSVLVASTMLLPAARADDKDVLEYRERIMKTLNAQTAALGQILSGVVSDDNAAAHLEIIAMTAKTALRAFEPKVLGGESKPEVWSNWADFSRRMAEFAEKTDAVAKLAKEQGTDAALANVLSALDCKSCHKAYREERH